MRNLGLFITLFISLSISTKLLGQDFFETKRKDDTDIEAFETSDPVRIQKIFQTLPEFTNDLAAFQFAHGPIQKVTRVAASVSVTTSYDGEFTSEVTRICAGTGFAEILDKNSKKMRVELKFYNTDRAASLYRLKANGCPSLAPVFKTK